MTDIRRASARHWVIKDISIGGLLYWFELAPRPERHHPVRGLQRRGDGVPRLRHRTPADVSEGQGRLTPMPPGIVRPASRGSRAGFCYAIALALALA